jgi:hypothetical protein
MVESDDVVAALIGLISPGPSHGDGCVVEVVDMVVEDLVA